MTFAHNKKATFNYEILERFEAGLALRGFEVKAIRAGRVSLVGAFVTIRDDELWLVGATVSDYQATNTPASYQPTRQRKLLLRKAEIAKLKTALNTKGLTIVPIKLYDKNRRLKLEIALARGKKKADKRQHLKARESKRAMERLLKQ